MYLKSQILVYLPAVYLICCGCKRWYQASVGEHACMVMSSLDETVSVARRIVHLVSSVFVVAQAHAHQHQVGPLSFLSPSEGLDEQGSCVSVHGL